MGVTYKIQQDIVDFIVQSKKETPSLSCRQLVHLVKERFDKDVSKSSVNAVTKEFHLSNPVGRRPVYKAPRNFSIPKEKKELLLKKVLPFLDTSEPPVAERPAVASAVSEDIPPPLSLRRDPLSAVDQKSQQLPLRSRNFGVLHEHMGISLLWFILVNACKGSHLKDFLLKYLGSAGATMADDVFPGVLLVLLFRDLFPEVEGDGLGVLWTIMGVDKPVGNLLREGAERIRQDKKALIALQTELDIVLTPVYHLCFRGKGGTRCASP